MIARSSSRALPIAALALLLSACGGNGTISRTAPALPFAHQPPAQSPPAFEASRPQTSSGKIKHVVIIIQENRSFNNLFYAYPGAKTATYGYGSAGQKITLAPVSLAANWDVEHDSAAFEAACNGSGSIPGTKCRMNGFNRELVSCGGYDDPCPSPYPQYAYVPHSEVKPYFDMAHGYVLADQMYASNFDASSFVSHQYIISGQAESSVNFPDGPWGCEGGSSDTVYMVGPKRQVPDGSEVACWNPTTLGDELDKAHISWAFYTAGIDGTSGIWSAYQAIKHVYHGPDWKKDIITPQTQFFGDVSKGRLRTVSWVTPTFLNSDHAGSKSLSGPQWVASLVNSIGKSKYWSSTAIFIFWDDYGGWYDPEPPAYEDYDGLGMRLPLLVVSSYARKGHVSHVHYEHGSILKFIEDQFGLGRLAASDKRANSPEKDCFDFNKPPRPFKTIPSVMGEEYFLHQPIDHYPPDTE
ncbi:MAG: alkaline phosphatase family protein [Candidatus Cybelea sp.]